MSLRLPVRQAAYVARASIAGPSPHLQYLLPRTQRRNAGWFGFGSSRKDTTEARFAKDLTKRQKEAMLAERVMDRTQGSSIFDEEIREAEGKQESEDDSGATPSAAHPSTSPVAYSRMKEHMARSLDPDPRWRVRYQRKKIMQMVRAGGELTKEERLKLTEKEVRLKSEAIATSTKKLVHLAHQVAGKTVDDAITQMRFSKKKMAREVKFYLEEARDKAIASRGMGLGAPNGELLPKELKITTKDGKKLKVSDPTRLYVDQAWVTKGPPRGNKMLFHSRGRTSMAKRPTSYIDLILKEEKTRIRLHEEREEKAAKKAPWVHLPNRPITAQRPYYSW
ncbi:ribosomal protein L22/L17 [Xylaria sp. CBS 124048]|nr:ribosomal protein L22/L17 [Xylaria sp. CBS 124048]